MKRSGKTVWLCPECRRPPEPERDALGGELGECECPDPVVRPFTFDPCSGRLRPGRATGDTSVVASQPRLDLHPKPHRRLRPRPERTASA